VFTAAGVRIFKTPVRAPGANAIAEHFVGSIRRQSLSSKPYEQGGEVDHPLVGRGGLVVAGA
jgi:hypothetical protein